MSTITNKISISAPAIVDGVDFPNIEMPFVGMEIYTVSDGKYWIVKSLKSKLIGAITVENAQIDTYEERVSKKMLDDKISVVNKSISDVNKTIGDIDSILDAINGEEV